MDKLSKIAVLFALFFMLPFGVNAHLIGGTGFSSGLFHPLFGLDHLLAMFAVGVIAVRSGGKAVFLLPLAFVSFMVFGGLLAVLGFSLPGVGTAVALSVLVFGVLVSFSQKLPFGISFACIALFALFHGHAHGEEMPLIASPLLYTAGFIVSTSFLHFAGAISANYAKKTFFAQKLFKVTSAVLSVAGILFLAGII